MADVSSNNWKRTFGKAELPIVAKEMVAMAKDLNIWLLEGEMGAGKTTFVKEIVKELGTTATVTSPTFSIVNEYELSNQYIYHFDFYRLKNEAEAYDIGVNEYFESGNLCLVEWPDKIPSLIPPHFFKIKFEINDPLTRTIHYVRH